MAERTKEFNEYLYQYWLNNFEEPCSYCANYIPCLEENCDKFTKIDKKSLFGTQQLTCTDLDFGTCPKLENTLCATCDCVNNFKWNGKVPELD